MRPALCAEALRLGRVLAGLMPREAEVHGLVALMELQASRMGARTDPAGEPVLLADQDRRRWDRLLIRRGLEALARARAARRRRRARTRCRPRSPPATRRRHSVEATDWERVAALYVVLGHLTPSPVVELNRAVAVGMAYGPARGLEIADRLTGHPALASYAHLPAVRGDLLAKLGRVDEAREEFGRAAALTGNERERALFRARAERMAPEPRPRCPAIGLTLSGAGSPHCLHVGDMAGVEQLITLGLEQDLLNGVPRPDRIHSSSCPACP